MMGAGVDMCVYRRWGFLHLGKEQGGWVMGADVDMYVYRRWGFPHLGTEQGGWVMGAGGVGMCVCTGGLCVQEVCVFRR